MSKTPHQRRSVPHRSHRVFATETRRFSSQRRLLVSAIVFLAFLAIVAVNFARLGSAQVNSESSKSSTHPTHRGFKRDSESANDTSTAAAIALSEKSKLHAESVPGEIIVRFRSEAPVAKGSSQFELAVVGERAEIPVEFQRVAGPELVRGLRLARVAPGLTERALAGLRARPDVLYAEPNYIRRAKKTPDDPRYSEMWGLKNTGQPSTWGGNPGTPGNDIRAEQAWDVTTGSKNVVVGIIDEGIDINHEDLSENIWINPGEIPNNGIDDDANGYIDDVNGWDFAHNDNTVFDYTEPTYPPSDNYSGDVDDHGTHVAGTIGARGNNGKGVAGVNWQVSLMSLKFLTGPEGSGTSADMLKAFAYAKAMRELWNSSGGVRGANIRVLNNSYGGGGFSQAELEAIRALGEAGILFVVAAGNEGGNNDMFPCYPSSYISPNLISVAASTGGGQKATFSNLGPGTVQMTAPGEHILSTTPRNSYEFFSGTSMATPHVAGSAALVSAAFPNISLAKLRSVILYSGEPAPWQYAYLYPVQTGRSLSVGNALQAVASTDTTSPAAVSQLRTNNNSFPNYGIQWTAPGDDGNSGKVAAYQVRFSETDLTDPARFDLATPLPGPIPDVSGSWQSAAVQVPWRHATGFIGVRAVDEVGNAGPISSIPLSIPAGVGDPYTVTENAPEPLSTGGTPLGLVADDDFKFASLPFEFKFYDSTRSNVWVSTNGALYFGLPPASGGVSEDFISSTNLMDGYRVIAGAWDDLRTDRRAGDDVYVVKPDENRIIFRWQAVTYDTPLAPGLTRGENPVNFEIELQSSGTIIVRYGDGNQKLFSVVGLGGGWPEAYVVDSHSALAELKDLTNAGAVSFALRNPPPPATANLSVTMTSGPNPVASGGQQTYSAQVYNAGPYDANNTVLTDSLPAGLAFVSCTTSQGTCTGPAPGATGVVTVNFGQLKNNSNGNITIVADVVAAPGATVSNTVTVRSSRFDSDLTNNSQTASAQVLDVSVFGGVASISTGYFTNFVLKHDGSVWGWGASVSRPLGAGTIFRDEARPVPMSGLSGVTMISNTSSHRLALKSNGTILSWGSNSNGEAGGPEYFYPEPVSVIALTDVSAISAGSRHSMALRADGTVWTWGANELGQLGLGSSDYERHSTPAQVPGLDGITKIAAGAGFSVAVRNDGSVWTWGGNQNGQLGYTGGQRNNPTKVSGVTDVKAIALSNNHVLALKSDGTVTGWGMNAFGQTGSLDFGNVNPTPTQVTSLTSVVGIAAGYGFSLALKSDGTVWGWGLNNQGLFGPGPAGSNPQAVPGQISALSNVIAVAAGNAHGVVLLSDGTVRTWGDNTYGQLGDGTTFTRVTPVQPAANSVVAAPSVSPGTYVGYSPISVRIATDTPAAVIHYTMNGQEPSENDPIVASGSNLTVSESLTLKARAFKSGWIPSGTSTATYTIMPPASDWQTVVLNPASIDQLKAWTIPGGNTYVYVVPKFPDAGYRVAAWGQPVRSGKDFSTNALIERYNGNSMQTVKTTAQIYDLGPLAFGNYTFTFQNSGAGVKALAFSVTGPPFPPNPIDDQRQFVRQQYRDFLNREPDAPGWDHWTGEITQCGVPFPPTPVRLPHESEAECIVRKRANTSAAFFLSPEFQNTGYFVLRVYRGSLGRMPYFGGSVPADNTKDEFTRDHAAVSAGIVVNNQLDQTVMYANKQAFVNQFVTRADFLSIYGGLDNEQYVDKLFQTTAITPTAGERQELINGLSAGNETRASVLFKIVDGKIEDGSVVLQTRYGQLFYDQQLNPGFVQMEYFGYLKRDPDDAGYAFWLAKLNQYGGNFVDAQMVMAFVSSPEYRARFGQP